MTPESKRINMDVMKLLLNDFKLKMINEDDMHAFFIQFHGPENSVYYGYVWNLRVEIPVDYPFEPPFIHFADSIYHPNIDETMGGICLNVLNESWSPMSDLVAVFELLIPQLLLYPNPDHPINLEAASLLINDPATYEARVKEYCERHATPEEQSKEESDDNEIEETSEDEMLDATDNNNNMGKLATEEGNGKDDNVSSGENVAGKADDPRLENRQ